MVWWCDICNSDCIIIEFLVMIIKAFSMERTMNPKIIIVSTSSEISTQDDCQYCTGKPIC